LRILAKSVTCDVMCCLCRKCYVEREQNQRREEVDDSREPPSTASFYNLVYICSVID